MKASEIVDDSDKQENWGLEIKICKVRFFVEEHIYQDGGLDEYVPGGAWHIKNTLERNTYGPFQTREQAEKEIESRKSYLCQILAGIRSAAKKYVSLPETEYKIREEKCAERNENRELAYLFFDNHVPECHQAAESLTKRGIAFVKVQCRGLVEPKMAVGEYTYRGLRGIKGAIERLDEKCQRQ